MHQSLVLFHSLSFLSKSRNGAFDAVEDDVLDLELVLVVGVMLCEVTELLKKKKEFQKMFSYNWNLTWVKCRQLFASSGETKSSAILMQL